MKVQSLGVEAEARCLQRPGAEAAKAREEFVGGRDVTGDLEFEGFGGGEFLFGAEALPETDFDAARGKVAGVIEEMGFDGERGAIEGGADAHVGDTAVAAGLAFENGAGDVDAARGEKFLLGFQVESWKSEFAAGAGAGNDFAGEDEGAAEETAGVRDVAFGNLLADERAGNDLAIENHGGMDDDVEAVAHAEFAKEFYVAGLLVAKAEIIADDDGADVELLHQNSIHKIFGR